MRIISWGIIGGGNVVETKSGPAFNRVAGSSLHAIMRRRLDSAKATALRIGAERWYDSVDDLLNDPNINAIYIATPPGLHLEHAIKCCQKNIPVYVEKPIARNYEEGKYIVDAFLSAGTPLFIAHYRRALPRFRKLKEIIDSGIIGKVVEVDFRLTRKPDHDASHPWLYDINMSGGGKFIDIAPHTVDILLFLFGAFSRVHGYSSRFDSLHGYEDFVSFIFQSVSGVTGSCNFNFLGTERRDVLNIYGTLGLIETSVHGNEPIKLTSSSGIQLFDVINPECIEEPMIAEVVNNLLGYHSQACKGIDALPTYRAIDEIVKDIYGDRGNLFSIPS